MSAHRKTLHRIERPGHVRYLTFSCLHRLPLFADDALKSAFADQLALARARLNFKLFAWVVMPEHVHLLVLPRPPELTIPQILMALKRPFAARALATMRAAGATEHLRDSDGQHRFWQRGGGYDLNVFSDDEITEKIRYIHDNPVRRDLVRTPVDWTSSSARALTNRQTAWPQIDRPGH